MFALNWFTLVSLTLGTDQTLSLRGIHVTIRTSGYSDARLAFSVKAVSHFIVLVTRAHLGCFFSTQENKNLQELNYSANILRGYPHFTGSGLVGLDGVSLINWKKRYDLSPRDVERLQQRELS